MNKAKFNPSAMKESANYKQEKKKQTNKERQQRFQKRAPEDMVEKVEIINNRNVRFSKRGFQNIYSWCFFGLFFVMVIIVIMTFGRMDTIAGIAIQKNIRPETIIKKIDENQTKKDQLIYQGAELIDRLYTVSGATSNDWQQQLKPYLADGLAAQELLSVTNTEELKVSNIQFIELSKDTENQETYHLTYAFDWLVGQETHGMVVNLKVSYNKGIVLLERPRLSSKKLEKPSKRPLYQPKAAYPKGIEVSTEDQRKIEKFLQQFFRLYVSNDENLSLISDLSGIGQATFRQMMLEKVVQTEKGDFIAYGSYDFTFEQSESQVKNIFKITIKPTKDSYFVQKLEE
ncbi:conjugal transfer protein [Enterococcus cecorum]|uniref:conjugal transfer protein n=1 Tax=Enterococcus cecorum TaxID=44008 RepID=UPI003263A2A7